MVFNLYYNRWEAEISKQKRKRSDICPNALTRKMYLSAMTAKSSAEMAPVKAVWILAYPLGRPCVCVCARTQGLQGLIEY